uniref:N-acetyltransferase domain-containing protein n=1 Tax=viral metagenome TaxID=1070528 RepID=A0A6C0EL78_9ZZZZ
MSSTEIIVLDTKSENYDTMASYIVGQAPGLCHGAVSHTYILQQMGEKPNYIFLSIKTNDKTRSKAPFITVSGFAIVFAKNNAYYIDVICAKGVGSRLINTILLQARMQRIRFVTLSALPNVITYYRKFGFVNTAPHETCGTREMTRKLAKLTHEDIPDFLTYLISKGHVRKKWCTKVETCDSEGYPMTWCNPDFRVSK